jgi:hypothetical protein
MWPFRRVPREPDVWDEAAQSLIDHGVDPEKVRRATRRIKEIARDGGLPELDPRSGGRSGAPLIDVDRS